LITFERKGEPNQKYKEIDQTHQEKRREETDKPLPPPSKKQATRNMEKSHLPEYIRTGRGQVMTVTSD